jgi:hypothetical protein
MHFPLQHAPCSSNRGQVRNRFASSNSVGGYRDINIKLKIGFSEGKNGRAELMTVRNLRFLATLTRRFNGLNADSIYLRWKSGRVTNRTIASCVRCRWEPRAAVCLSAFYADPSLTQVRLRAFHELLSAKQDMHGNYVLMRNLMSS